VIAAVVTHYQTPEETRTCLRSLRGQVGAIVVVDNGSTPPFTAEGVELIRSPRNLGFGGGCNLGIRKALDLDAVKILLINSDAEVEPGCVAQLDQVLAERSDIGIVAPAILQNGRVESLGVRFSRWSGRMVLVTQRDRPGRLIECEAVTGCCALIRREVFLRAGLFDEELFYGFEDLDLCLRAAAAGFASACRSDATVHHLGARSIGARSPRRLYFAARNHLRVAESAAPLPAPAAAARSAAIIGYNLLHALVTAPAPRVAGVSAVLRGAYHHYRRRYGP
jgi:GT2 family glycosyltransferase